jgi:hypothetical protein
MFQANDSAGLTPLGDYNNDPSYWPGGIGIYRDVDAFPGEFPISYLNNTNATTTTTTADSDAPDPGSAYMYRVDNATALPIAVIGEHVWDSFDTDIPFSQVT